MHCFYTIACLAVKLVLRNGLTGGHRRRIELEDKAKVEFNL